MEVKQRWRGFSSEFGLKKDVVFQRLQQVADTFDDSKQYTTAEMMNGIKAEIRTDKDIVQVINMILDRLVKDEFFRIDYSQLQAKYIKICKSELYNKEASNGTKQD